MRSFKIWDRSDVGDQYHHQTMYYLETEYGKSRYNNAVDSLKNITGVCNYFIIHLVNIHINKDVKGLCQIRAVWQLFCLVWTSRSMWTLLPVYLPNTQPYFCDSSYTINNMKYNLEINELILWSLNLIKWKYLSYMKTQTHFTFLSHYLSIDLELYKLWRPIDIGSVEWLCSW